MARLKIQVDEADRAPARRLVGLELHRRLDGDRRVAGAAAAWNEGHEIWPVALGALGSRNDLMVTSDNVENFMRHAVGRHPIGISRPDQPLIVAGRNVIADEDEEQNVVSARGHLDQPIDRVLCVGEWEQDVVSFSRS
jgi:hypothetical protein